MHARHARINSEALYDTMSLLKSTKLLRGFNKSLLKSPFTSMNLFLKREACQAIAGVIISKYNQTRLDRSFSYES